MATLLQRANFSGTNGSHFFLDLYQDNSQSIDGNASAIRYYAYVGSIGGYRGSGSSSPVRINGQIVGYFSSIGANSNTLIGYLDVIVNHNDEGKASASYTASADTNWSLGDASISGNFNLPTIPRSDRVTSPTTIYVEKTYTITTTQNSSSFTHTIKYSCGSVSGTIATGVGSSCTWTIPKTLYETFTDYSYAEGKYICETYSGSKLIGTTETTFYVYADGDLARPTHTFEYNTTDSISSTLTGSSKGIIKGISDISYTITGIPKYGASIQNYYLSTSKKYPQVPNTGTIKAVTSNKYYVSVRDTRYIYSIQTEETLTPFVDYVMLAITDLTLERENELSKNVYMNLKGNYFNGNFGATSNSLTALLYYKESTSNTWSSAITLKPTISENTFSISNQLVGSIFDYQKDYDFKVVLNDKVFTDETINATRTVTRGTPLLDIGENDILFHGKKLVDFIEEKVRMNVDLMYPVGSIYLSVNSTNPSQLFGGTWKQWGTGRVPVGIDTNNSKFNTVEKTGGEETHKLSIDEMPRHRVPFPQNFGTPAKSASDYTTDEYKTLAATKDAGYLNRTGQTSYVGGDKYHNNLQPYITCYMWKRTA